MTKLIIQIPAYNEEKTLGVTFNDLPKAIEGIDEIETLLIDDGSTDRTVEIARGLGFTHIISSERNQGLAKTFMKGITTAVALGADIIVNTDADNQYSAKDMEKLVKPILKKEADIAIGARPIDDIKHFSWLKKLFQKLGSSVMRLLSSAEVADAPSGFRAFTKDVAQNLNIFDNFTYTLEMIIQSGAKGFKIISVPVGVNAELRKSRLFKSQFHYIFRSAKTMIRMFIVYRPFRFFAILSGILSLFGVLLGLRFIWFYLFESGVGHIQSLILAAILLIIGFQTMLIAIIADLLSVNRKLLESLQGLVKNERGL